MKRKGTEDGEAWHCSKRQAVEEKPREQVLGKEAYTSQRNEKKEEVSDVDMGDSPRGTSSSASKDAKKRKRARKKLITVELADGDGEGKKKKRRVGKNDCDNPANGLERNSQKWEEAQAETPSSSIPMSEYSGLPLKGRSMRAETPSLPLPSASNYSKSPLGGSSEIAAPPEKRVTSEQHQHYNGMQDPAPFQADNGRSRSTHSLPVNNIFSSIIAETSPSQGDLVRAIDKSLAVKPEEQVSVNDELSGLRAHSDGHAVRSRFLLAFIVLVVVGALWYAGNLWVQPVYCDGPGGFSPQYTRNCVPCPLEYPVHDCVSGKIVCSSGFVLWGDECIEDEEIRFYGLELREKIAQVLSELKGEYQTRHYYTCGRADSPGSISQQQLRDRFATDPKYGAKYREVFNKAIVLMRKLRDGHAVILADSKNPADIIWGSKRAIVPWSCVIEHSLRHHQEQLAASCTLALLWTLCFLWRDRL